MPANEEEQNKQQDITGKIGSGGDIMHRRDVNQGTANKLKLYDTDLVGKDRHQKLARPEYIQNLLNQFMVRFLQKRHNINPRLNKIDEMLSER